MDFQTQLKQTAEKNNSWLCVGLDIDSSKVPGAGDGSLPVLEKFLRRVIDSTAPYVCAYKPNAAFFEVLGLPGMKLLEKTIKWIPKDIPVILDVKRGDIGNTARMYARACFDYLGADAVTLSPYMGQDSVQPFLDYKDKHSFILVLTSNAGSRDLQMKKLSNGPLFMETARKVHAWNRGGNAGAVIGATKPAQMKQLRTVLRKEIFLIPGIGTQGGDLEKSVKYAFLSGGCGIFNASRAVLYAKGKNGPAREAKKYRDMIGQILNAGET